MDCEPYPPPRQRRVDQCPVRMRWIHPIHRRVVFFRQILSTSLQLCSFSSSVHIVHLLSIWFLSKLSQFELQVRLVSLLQDFRQIFFAPFAPVHILPLRPSQWHSPKPRRLFSGIKTGSSTWLWDLGHKNWRATLELIGYQITIRKTRKINLRSTIPCKFISEISTSHTLTLQKSAAWPALRLFKGTPSPTVSICFCKGTCVTWSMRLQSLGKSI